MKKLVTLGKRNQKLETPASKSSLISSGTPETPHVYLFSPSNSSPSPEDFLNGSVNGHESTNGSDISLCLMDKQAEVTSLRHKIQCMESYESDLVEELKILQEENEGLRKKMSEMKKMEESSDSFVIQSCSSPIAFDCSYGSEFDSRLSEELSKSKANFSLLEDRNFELALARDEAIAKAQKKDEMLKEMKTELKLLQQELWENLQEKQALVSDVNEKVSIIESLQNHCEELKEMLNQRKEPSKLLTPVGMIKYFHPSRSLNSSGCLTDMSINEEPLDLGIEVIDLQLQETKLALASMEETLKTCEENLRSEQQSHEDTTSKLKSTEEKQAELEIRVDDISKENLRLKTLLFDDNNNCSTKIWQLQASNNDLDAQRKETNFALRIALEELISVQAELKLKAENVDVEKISELTEELQYLRRENNMKLWDLEVTRCSVQNLEQNLTVMRENWVRTELKMKSRGKKIDKGTFVDFGVHEKLLAHEKVISKFQERIKILEHQNKVQLEKLKENVAQESKQKYKERFETYRKQVASIMKQEGDTTTKLKKNLGDANGRIRQLETEIDSMKREIGQLRRDYRQSQLVISSFKDKEKHAAKFLKQPEHSNKTDKEEIVKKSVPMETLKKFLKRNSAGSPTRSLPASPTKSSPRRSLPVSVTPRFDEDFFTTPRLKKLPEDGICLDDDRKSELCRRNSMVPPHMKSCYPMEYIVCEELEVETLFKPPPPKMNGFARKIEIAVTQSAPSSPICQRRNGKLQVRFENRL